MLNEEVDQPRGFFGRFSDYGSQTLSTAWNFIQEAIIGDAYQAYMHTEEALEEFDRRSWESGTNVGIGYIGGSWLRKIPFLRDWLPKFVYVSGGNRKSFLSVAEYGEPSAENPEALDAAARSKFKVVEKLLGLKVLNNLQGADAAEQRHLMKDHLNSSSSLEELHSYSISAFENFITNIDPKESFAASIYRLTVSIMCHCFFGISTKLDKKYIPELMQMAHLITNPHYSNSQIKEASKNLRKISAELLREGSDGIYPDKFIAAHAGLTDDMSEDEKIERLKADNIAGSFLAAVNLSDMIMKTMIEISKNSELKDALLAELQDDKFNKQEDLLNASLLERVYCEAQRLFSPSIIVRETSKFTVLETVDEQNREHKTTVPPHSILFAPIRPRLVSRNLWESPELFIPDRFLGEKGKERKKLLNPFSEGLRACPAKYGFTRGIFNALIREYVLNVETLTLDQEVEEISAFSINTSFKKTYHAEYTLRKAVNSKGKEPCEAELSDEESLESSYSM